LHIRNRNRKLKISTAPTKAKSREPAYSQALVRKKSINRLSMVHQSNLLLIFHRLHQRNRCIIRRHWGLAANIVNLPTAMQ